MHKGNLQKGTAERNLIHQCYDKKDKVMIDFNSKILIIWWKEEIIEQKFSIGKFCYKDLFLSFPLMGKIAVTYKYVRIIL